MPIRKTEVNSVTRVVSLRKVTLTRIIIHIVILVFLADNVRFKKSKARHLKVAKGKYEQKGLSQTNI